MSWLCRVCGEEITSMASLEPGTSIHRDCYAMDDLARYEEIAPARDDEEDA